MGTAMGVAGDVVPTGCDCTAEHDKKAAKAKTKQRFMIFKIYQRIDKAGLTWFSALSEKASASPALK
jgi:hypothetical protein